MGWLISPSLLSWWFQSASTNRSLAYLPLTLPAAGTFSGNYQGTDTHTTDVCHEPWQPFQNHPTRPPGGWATPWSAKVMWMDNVNELTPCLSPSWSRWSLVENSVEEHLCSVVPRVTPMTQPVEVCTELNLPATIKDTLKGLTLLPIIGWNHSGSDCVASGIVSLLLLLLQFLLPRLPKTTQQLSNSNDNNHWLDNSAHLCLASSTSWDLDSRNGIKPL